ncbi:ABC transporter ATP-binding protein [Agrobacterium rubi]|uniref:ABC transporter ATP-binding protein n=1 Tax=Agrobacterium rubi TaxID=28099 RepID=A0AAE7R1G5_9HYPH|nr:ABC transporter ATP-binding protein [Agrobacterium rubi]NTE85132.1 ABC transporter ATP-binding protein [Agrobacterium rubi]NTF01064.1 ABC transporter ATP-binding protein [Agrobacterium rubi]NTF35252.1 ABC transporter ATP-binding protein [Agrobacterium rubi]OCJ48728.1 amino acid ABC transporter ATP-binding protein [Agrobacterium rubi]QTG00455.1 ABC transporter ATP-binding protein [Agrobacterium rubi]
MIEVENLTKDYDGATVVDNVSLTIDARSITVIVGTSGSGKTTLLRMINRLVEPTSGIIRIDGQNILDMPGYQLRRSIGYAIQGHGLFPHRTVAQNIATVPELIGWDRSRIDAKVTELLELFQLDPALYANRFPNELSGGQQQRVGVARALAAEPNILLMDEPFGALDPIIRAKAQDDLLAIQKKLGVTIVLVTHDMDEAFHLADRIAVMDKGKIVQYGKPAELVCKPATDFVRTMIGERERPLRLLSVATVGEIVEPGEAEGEPLPAATSQRDALSAMLWTGRDMLPVTGPDGQAAGRIRREVLLHNAAGSV